MTLRGTDLAAYGETLGTLALDARLDGRRLAVQQLQLDKPQPAGNGRLIGTGWVDLDWRADDVGLNTQNVELLGLTLPSGAPVRGAVDMTARGQGTIDNHGSATFHLRSVQVGNCTATSRSTHRWAINGPVSAPSRTSSTSRPVPTYQHRRRMQARPRLRLTIWISASLPMKSDAGVSGTLRAHLNAAGNLTDPADGSASATIDRLEMTWNNQPFSVDGPATIRYANQEVRIDGLTAHALDSSVTLKGMLPLDERNLEGAVDLDAKLNLATLAMHRRALGSPPKVESF